MQKKTSVWKYLVYVTSLGASLTAPLVVCVLGAMWLRDKFSLGGWVMVPAILLGLATGGWNLIKFFRFTQREAERKEDTHGRF